MTAGPRLAPKASTLCTALGELAELEFRLGDWMAANEAAREALRSARAAAVPREVMGGLVLLALIEAGLGHEHACRRHAAEAVQLARGLADPPAEALAGEALGRLELGLGRVDAAIERLESVGRICGEYPRAGTHAVAWAPDLADARLRRGDRLGARRALADVERGVRRRPGSFALVAASERSRAMLAADHAYGRLFMRALEWSAWSRQPFELARTELCYGERLRRARRRPEAREHLEAALGSFEELGARPWAQRASNELAAVGA
jgi:tetratricopeptide (TPR) repeat protein